LEVKILNLLNEGASNLSLLQEKKICKFVLVATEDELNLVFGSFTRYPYHANLVDLFCHRREIPSAWVNKPDLVEIIDAAYQIRGGGWLEIDPPKGTLKFFGESTVYGRFAQSDLNHVLTENELFADFQAVVRH
jgi:hypothetical protein